MKLVDLVENIESIDEDLIIFQENKEDVDSDIILLSGEQEDDDIKVEHGKNYYYLIEVFLAREFIEDWVQSLDYTPDAQAIAKRLYEYAINDA